MSDHQAQETRRMTEARLLAERQAVERQAAQDRATLAAHYAAQRARQ